MFEFNRRGVPILAQGIGSQGFEMTTAASRKAFEGTDRHGGIEAGRDRRVEQMFFHAPPTIVFHHRIVGAERLRHGMVVDRIQQGEQSLLIVPGGRQPGSQGLLVLLSGVNLMGGDLPEPGHRGQEAQMRQEPFTGPLEVEFLVQFAFAFSHGAFLVIVCAVAVGHAGIGGIVKPFFRLLFAAVLAVAVGEIETWNLPVGVRIGLQEIEELLDERPGFLLTIFGRLLAVQAEHPAQGQGKE